MIYLINTWVQLYLIYCGVMDFREMEITLDLWVALRIHGNLRPHSVHTEQQ